MMLSNSAISTFRACPRSFFFSYVLCRVLAAVAPALSFGRAWHKVLETLFLHGRKRMVATLVDTCTELPEQEAAKLCALIEHYKFNPKALGYEIEEIEHQFERPIRNPKTGRSMHNYTIGGKLDLVLHHLETGARAIGEHKTTSSEIRGYGPYWSIKTIDSQISIYCLAIDADRAVYDATRKPALKMCGKDTDSQSYQDRVSAAISEDVERYYQHREIIKTERDLFEAQIDLWQQAHQIKWCEKTGQWPRNSNSCERYKGYSTCQYLDVCSGQARIDDDSMFRTKDSLHEELT